MLKPYDEHTTVLECVIWCRNSMGLCWENS